MIEVLTPGWLSIIVDGGRYGYGDIGVPPSSALDKFAYNALNHLTESDMNAPVIEVMGNDFSLKIHVDVVCAITGARVIAYIDDMPLKPWYSFMAKKGSILRVKEVEEGLRYYVGFSGFMDIDRVINSLSTNLECRFGGYKGRPLMKGDRIGLKEVRLLNEKSTPEKYIPPMGSPHVLRIMEGAEIEYFTAKSLKRFVEKKENICYAVSTKSNRTGIRLEGEPLIFRRGVEKGIISEGILPGTIQASGDGMPIIMLYERTIGGYARVAIIAKADLDLLAHLKPKDKVMFEMIGVEEAENLWNTKLESISFVYKNN
ncbi:MAG: biotin-dependent carboxyltransferase family protein [Proteobacteria bacterium]|nr:biotin-dependent carboxyltransferase family protein [Pseudomonadota bacterium]